MENKKNDRPFTTQKDLALDRLKKYCTYRDRCHSEVRNKLLELGIYGDDLEEVMAELIIEGYLNEERYARSFARGKFRINEWGKNKIILQLKAKGIPPSLISVALKEISDEAYRKTLGELLSRKNENLKAANDYQRRQKLAQFAIGKGYEFEIIQEVLEENIL